MTVASIAATRTFPVMEVFGPVVQGEGPVAGQVTHFIRFGLCDYRCSWCDSMFAVDPAQVKEHAALLNTETILDRLSELGPAPWVTLSGGNPAIHGLLDLRHGIQQVGMSVAVETQGSVWNDWLTGVDHLIVSPKPPSSGMVSDKHLKQTARFMEYAERWIPSDRRSIKVVVFDDLDLEFAEAFMLEYPWVNKFLSVGTDVPEPGETLAETRRKVCDRYRWLCERTPGLTVEVTTFPQLHVLAYGHLRGV